MIELRKLAAIDIALLGYKLILVEYAFGVGFSLALGIFVLLRSHSPWQIWLGAYFICLGINYIPMVVWTVSFGNRANARMGVGDELTDRPRAMARYRRLSLVLLLPLVPPILILLERRRKSRR